MRRSKNERGLKNDNMSQVMTAIIMTPLVLIHTCHHYSRLCECSHTTSSLQTYYLTFPETHYNMHLGIKWPFQFHHGSFNPLLPPQLFPLCRPLSKVERHTFTPPLSFHPLCHLGGCWYDIAAMLPLGMPSES